LFGTPVWYACLVHLSATPVWYTCLVHLFDAPVWYTCLAHLFGKPDPQEGGIIIPRDSDKLLPVDTAQIPGYLKLHVLGLGESQDIKIRIALLMK
jgi:hypothetical protein